MSASTASDSWIEPDSSLSSSTLDAFLEGIDRDVPEIDSERWVSYSIDDLYPDWQKNAHCRGVGVSYYFGEDDEQLPASIKRVRRASKLCEVCPVYVECLTWALTRREEYGVWAGTSGRMRRKIFKLMDTGETTVPEVVERFLDGQGDTYRNGEASRTSDFADLHPEPIPRLDQGRAGLRAPHRGEVAL